MTLCDLCGRSRDCAPKEIDGKVYDICAECWNPLAERLQGKGRAKTRERETVILPALPAEPQVPKIKPLPEPPKIWGQLGRPE